MSVCILGNGLTALTLAKALVNLKIRVDIFCNKKTYKICNLRTIGIAKTMTLVFITISNCLFSITR